MPESCFINRVQTGRHAKSRQKDRPRQTKLNIGSAKVPLRFYRNRLARRYILRVREDGSIRVTVPPFGNKTRAYDFAESNVTWIERQLVKQQLQAQRPKKWLPGAQILVRGARVNIKTDFDRNGGVIQFGDQSIPLLALDGNLRPAIEQHLWRLATGELVNRTFELASIHQFSVRRVIVRSQRTRWGSCSANGNISLNWRLIQAPGWVSDYLILHELMHLREMNHARRYWRWIRQVCPRYQQAEVWLKQHVDLLH